MKYPRNTVWYVEARPSGGPREVAQMGSAVAVRLYRAGEPNSHRKVLLTCAHVVRGMSTDQKAGYGDCLGEFLCWRPGNGYTKPDDFPGRQTGVCPGSFPALISEISPLAAGDVPMSNRRPALDWVILEVQDPKFQDMHCVRDVGVAADGAPLSVVGYPGGSVTWQTNSLVENLVSDDLGPTRQAEPGTIKLDGNGKAGPGMSGGGVFDAEGKLVGIHRSQTAVELAFGAVDANYIRGELSTRGWMISPSPIDELEGISETSEKVRDGVSHLAAMGRNAGTRRVIRAALSPLTLTLERLEGDLAAMEACKECHEVLLHRAGLKIGQCVSAIKEWLGNPRSMGFRFGIMKALSELEKDALRFADVAPRCATVYPPGVGEARDFQEALAEVRALISSESQDADQPLRLVIQRIINNTPAQLQAALGRMVSQLPFGELAGAVAQSKLDTSPGTELEGLMELLPLQSLTKQLVGEHYAWQDLDRELRLMDADIEALSAGREDMLSNISFMARRVLKKVRDLQLQENAIGEVSLMLDAASQLQTLSAEKKPDIVTILNAFLELRTREDHLFTKADQRLLAACQRLTGIILPLQQLLTVLP